jgi:ribosomal protein S27E
LDSSLQGEGAPNKFAKVKMRPETSTPGDQGEEQPSGFVGHIMPRLPGGASFPVGNVPMSNIGDPAVFGGQMISPTHPQGPLQYMQHQVRWSRTCTQNSCTICRDTMCLVQTVVYHHSYYKLSCTICTATMGLVHTVMYMHTWPLVCLVPFTTTLLT